MANLRRHFNFGLNKPLSTNPSGSHGPIGSDGAFPDNSFSRSAFMNEVCSFLDHCSAYIQALNSFCGSGTMLAKSLVRVFHNVPMYREVAALFLSAWDDMSRATAAASAAVKTETLMTLQDVLNQLEGEEGNICEDSGTLSESIQAVASCLASYIELQVQFSYSAWKSLSKLSKNLATDGISRISAEHKGGSVKSSELTGTIKKHFAHLLQKFASSKGETQHSQFYVDFMDHPSESEPDSANVPNQKAVQGVNSPTSRMWQSYPYPENTQSTTLKGSPAKSAEEEVAGIGALDAPGELEDVINLLSCKPSKQQSKSLSPDNSFINGMMASLPLNHSWTRPQEGQRTERSQDVPSRIHAFPASPLAPSSMNGKQTWPRQSNSSAELVFGMDHWVWSAGHFENSLNVPQSDSLLIKSKDKVSSQSDTRSNSPPGLWSPDKQGWNSVLGGDNGSSSDTSSNNGQDSDTFLMGLNLAGRDLVASVRQRRHSSSDGPHDSLDNSPKSLNVDLEVRAVKTSTWPLKQSSPRPSGVAASHLPVSAPFSPSEMCSNWGSASSQQDTGSGSEENKYFLFGHGS